MIAIAIDDEPIALDVIKSHASKVPFITLENTFTNAFDAIIHLQNNKVDLLFLDIKMPDINGIDFLKTLKNPPIVIFTTAYSEHAVQSFELDALDYLLKPFSLPRFLKACNKAKDIYDLRLNQSDSVSDSIFIKDGYEQIRILLTDILYLEASGNYTLIHLKNNKTISTRVTITDMAEMLSPKKFCRIHRAYIVAKDQVIKFDKNYVWLENKCIPIGTTYNFSI
ncbi:LytR/AlgR family response regulator transcription factor [Pedobacter flavus]|uniref:LytTR family DNA-binding domain-containing protein n=1 Tax=Pedobacter flavus TaxID=3113906 RepID=A0ABU7GYQ3_9SPHI|nr:LytTR family DNA-binding domain-containing protein [Pedobacter sp. VNH31]MEE1884085.1 LytTR family DNA-binding domain-containing protein [Pedobacter sp. VNH31]